MQQQIQVFLYIVIRTFFILKEFIIAPSSFTCRLYDYKDHMCKIVLSILCELTCIQTTYMYSMQFSVLHDAS